MSKLSGAVYDGYSEGGCECETIFLYSLFFRFISDRIESVFDNYL